jgi:hypothetical protein
MLVQKVEKVEKLYFGRFDEGFNGFAKKMFHSAIDSRNSKFKT